MSSAELSALVADAVDDFAVRERLLPLRGRDFAEALISVAADRGFAITADEVEAAVRDARHTWWERWV
jgi:hypothetical protein